MDRHDGTRGNDDTAYDQVVNAGQCAAVVEVGGGAVRAGSTLITSGRCYRRDHSAGVRGGIMIDSISRLYGASIHPAAVRARENREEESMKRESEQCEYVIREVRPMFFWKKCELCKNEFRRESGWSLLGPPIINGVGSLFFLCSTCAPTRGVAMNLANTRPWMGRMPRRPSIERCDPTPDGS